MATAAEEVKKQKAKEYENYVKSVTPRHNLFKNMGFAFVSGGIICTLGQMIMNFCKNQGMDSETCGSWTSLSDFSQCASYRSEYLPQTGKMGRSRYTGTDYRVCKLGSLSCN